MPSKIDMHYNKVKKLIIEIWENRRFISNYQNKRVACSVKVWHLNKSLKKQQNFNRQYNLGISGQISMGRI